MKHFLFSFIALVTVGVLTCASMTRNDKLSPVDQPITYFEVPARISHKQYVDKLNQYDISLTAFEGFDTIDMRGREQIGTQRFYELGINKRYPIGFENRERTAMFLFPEILADKNMTKQGKYIENEIRTNERDIKLDIRPLINVIAQDDMSQFANADTVVIYELDLLFNDVPYMDAYRHCIGVYLRKYAHPALLTKIMLTDAAYEHKDKYIGMLLDNISYGNHTGRESCGT